MDVGDELLDMVQAEVALRSARVEILDLHSRIWSLKKDVEGYKRQVVYAQRSLGSALREVQRLTARLMDKARKKGRAAK